MDLSFPIREHLQRQTYESLIEAARHFNASRFTQAKEIIEQLLSSIPENPQELP
jgi:hypothetical protein